MSSVGYTDRRCSMNGWYLIRKKTVDELRAMLCECACPQARRALHDLETECHFTDTVPDDYAKQEEVRSVPVPVTTDSEG